MMHINLNGIDLKLGFTKSQILSKSFSEERVCVTANLTIVNFQLILISICKHSIRAGLI